MRLTYIFLDLLSSALVWYKYYLWHRHQQLHPPHDLSTAGCFELFLHSLYLARFTLHPSVWKAIFICVTVLYNDGLKSNLHLFMACSRLKRWTTIKIVQDTYVAVNNHPRDSCGIVDATLIVDRFIYISCVATSCVLSRYTPFVCYELLASDFGVWF